MKSKTVKRYGPFKTEIPCRIRGCERFSYTGLDGLCWSCYRYLKRRGFTNELLSTLIYNKKHRKTCIVEGCKRLSTIASKFCYTHRAYNDKHGAPIGVNKRSKFQAPAQCSIPGCGKPARSSRIVLCNAHGIYAYSRVRLGKMPIEERLKPMIPFIRMIQERKALKNA